MDESTSQDPGADDSRDARTGQGSRPRGSRGYRIGPPITSSSAHLPDDYSVEDAEEPDTPLDEGMDRMIDPSLGRERLSTNMDVLDLDSSWIQESEEPDFTEDPGTTDLVAVVEEGETYFPPVDPPIRASRNQNAGVVGGFSGTSLEEPTEPEDYPSQVLSNDDGLAEQVMYALATDSYTADLNIEVEVTNRVVYLHGKVGSLEDIEQAEQVAGNVPGVDDVEEDLEIV